jgi:hypothetical protein
VIPIDGKHSQASTGKQHGRGGASASSPNDDDVVALGPFGIGCHSVSPVATL